MVYEKGHVAANLIMRNESRIEQCPLAGMPKSVEEGVGDVCSILDGISFHGNNLVPLVQEMPGIACLVHTNIKDQSST